jgi:hypothetical protein
MTEYPLNVSIIHLAGPAASLWRDRTARPMVLQPIAVHMGLSAFVTYSNCVGFPDVYVRRCSLGVWTDWRII